MKDQELTAQQAETLIMGLRRHLTLVTSLHTLLRDEYKALKFSDATALDQLAQAKLGLLAQLEQNELLRRKFFEQIATDLPAGRLGELTNRMPSTRRATYRNVVEELATAIAQCAQQNQINGASIGIIKRFTQDLIAHLQGQPNGSAAGLVYGRDGQGESGAASSGVVRA